MGGSELIVLKYFLVLLSMMVVAGLLGFALWLVGRVVEKWEDEGI